MYNFSRYLNVRSATSPVLSNDGASVAFLSDITGNFQVWRVGTGSSPQDAWPQQLTFFTDRVWELHGTSQSDHLIAVSDIGGNERQQFYLITNAGAADKNTAHDVRRLTENSDAIHTFGAWSGDGRQIVYTCNLRNNVDFDIFRLDVHTGESQLLRECSGRRAVVAWVSDDRYVLSIDAVATEQIDLYLLDLRTGEERHLTADTPQARYDQLRWRGESAYVISDRTHDRGGLCRLDLANGALTEIMNAEDFDAHIGDCRCELELLVTAPIGKTAAVTVNADGYSYLFLVNLESGQLEMAGNLPGGVISNMQFSGDSSQLIFDLQTPQQPSDIWSLTLGDHAMRQVTYSNQAGIDAQTFVAPELNHYETFDGIQIPTFLYIPQTPPPPAGFPCILYVHGGPASQQRPDFDVRFQYFLSRGYALLVPNVRGSMGYGRRYMMLDDVEKRMDSVTDLKHAVDWLQGYPEIDSRRIAIYGRSYGGFMVLAALTEYPHLFAAGIDVVGIADWVTFLERTSPWRRQHREREYGSLARDREFLHSISPLHKAERIRAPLLVLAGDNDPRVPLFESEQIAQRVQSAGGEVHFIHYADEGHKFSKLANRIDSFTQMARFLEMAMGAALDHE